MAYVTTNPPVCVIPSVGNHAAVWLYKSDDIHTDVDAADYFTDGKKRGLKVNDLMFVIKTTATVGATVHVVSTVGTSAATVSPAILA